jgi:hypothetical protein
VPENAPAAAPTPAPAPAPPPADGTGAGTGPAPAARALVCAHCRKGRLDPAGKRPGEQIQCPACGKPVTVTLQMTLGEDRIIERQRNVAKALRSFGELSEEEKLEFIAGQDSFGQLFYFLQYQVGPKGMTGVYLGLVVLYGGLMITYALTYGGMKLREIAWYWWLVAVLGGGFLGVLGWFVHGTAMHYYQKHKAAKEAANPRRSKAASARRNASTVRTKAPTTAAKRPGPDGPAGGP